MQHFASGERHGDIMGKAAQWAPQLVCWRAALLWRWSSRAQPLLSQPSMWGWSTCTRGFCTRWLGQPLPTRRRWWRVLAT